MKTVKKRTPNVIKEGKYSRIFNNRIKKTQEADIDEDAVEKALERAQAALKEDGGSEERAAAEASMMKSIAMLEVARRRGKRS